MSAPVILVLRALGLGDLLTAVPALRALRRAHRDARLELAAPGALGEMLPLVEVVDRLHPTAGLEDFEWSFSPPDLAVNLHGRGPQSHRALARAGAERTLAFASPELGVEGPEWRADEHEVDRWCRLVEEGLGIPVDRDDGQLMGDPGTAHSGAIVVHPGAASAARRWPSERFAELAARLAVHGDVRVTGSDAERSLVRDVVERAGLPTDRGLAGRTTLSELCGLVAGARLVVSGDTGVAHLAAAYARPAVAVFGPTPPDLWAPRWGRTVVLWEESPSGDPHADTPHPALLTLEVDTVLAAARAQLDRDRVLHLPLPGPREQPQSSTPVKRATHLH